jgi:hypothetical protein
VTPDYDEQGKKESFAMLRQLGPFTIFFYVQHGRHEMARVLAMPL